MDIADQFLWVRLRVRLSLGGLGRAREGRLVVEAVQVAAGFLELLDPFLRLYIFSIDYSVSVDLDLTGFFFRRSFYILHAHSSPPALRYRNARLGQRIRIVYVDIKYTIPRQSSYDSQMSRVRVSRSVYRRVSGSLLRRGRRM